MPTQSTEADIVFNRASIALAKSQRLVASWLPPRAEAKRLVEDEIAKDETSTGRLGVGASLPPEMMNGNFRPTELSANDKLRKQLLGKHARKTPRSGPGKQDPVSSRRSAVDMKSQHARREAPVSDDDEEGRSSAITSSRRKERARPQVLEPASHARGEGRKQPALDGGEQEMLGSDGSASDAAPLPKKRKAARSQNFLDEVLAERQKKQKRKKG